MTPEELVAAIAQCERMLEENERQVEGWQPLVAIWRAHLDHPEHSVLAASMLASIESLLTTVEGIQTTIRYVRGSLLRQLPPQADS